MQSDHFFPNLRQILLDLQRACEVNLSRVRKIFSSQSAFLNPRLLLGVAICLTGISLALVVFGQNRWNNARPNSPGLGVIVTGSPDVTPTPTPTPSCVPPPSNMVSWWPGDGNANDIWDSNPGTLQGGATFAPGEVGQAFSLDGIDGRVDVPDNPNLNPGTGSFTVDAWVFKTRLQNDMAIAPVVAKHVGDFLNGYVLSAGNGGIGFTTNEIEAAAGDANGNRVDLSTGVNISLNTWTHLAMTFDGSTKTLNIYKDGVLIGSGSNPQVGSIDPSGQIFRIGSYRRIFFGRIETFPGEIDEVEYFNRALSQAEIQSIVNAGSSGKCKPQCVPPPANMVAWYPGDGNANDISGDNYNGTLSGGVTFTPGEVNQAFTFNGTDGEVILPNSASAPLLNFGPTDSFTVDAWIKPDPSVLGTQRAAVSLTYVCSPEEIVFALLIDGRIDFDIRDSNGIAAVTVSPSSILDGNWHQVTGVRDVSTHTVKLYLDGKISQWFARADGRGVVFILNAATVAEAKAITDTLPLAKAGIATFDYVALTPLTPLRMLIAEPPSAPKD